MRGEATPIDPDSLAKLTDAELVELAEKLEQLHLHEQRDDIVAFALNTEVPGTPSPYSENDRIKLLKRKEAMRREKVSDTEYDDAEDVEPEEPDGEFYPQQLELAEHHQLMLEVMQALVEEEPIVGPLANGFEGRYADGVIFMLPPGSAKSSFMSVVAPAFILGKYDGLDVISLSYGADLARRFGRRVRHIARQPRYQRQFGTTVTADNQAVDQWSLTNGSTYKATGILGGVTGNRADLCLVASTQLQTPNGIKTIDQIRKGDYVLSYDHEGSHRPVYRRVAAVARRRTDEIWRVRAASGHLVEATGNHPFFTGGSWTQAASLVVGDVLLRSVRDVETHSSLRGGEGSVSTSILRQAVLDQGRQSCPRNAGSLLHGVRQAIGWHVARGARLLKALSFRGGKKAGGEEAKSGAGKIMRHLRRNFQAAHRYAAESLLLAKLQECWARLASGRTCEPQLAAWTRSKSLSGGQWPEVSRSKASGDGARRLLRHMQLHGELAGSSRGWRQPEQCAGEHRDLVRPMPLETAWGRAGKAAPDSVAMVERVRQNCDVWDIEVEDTHCFFANGILVHNCILDDPLAGREEAESDIIREKTWQAFKDDVLTRLKPRGKVGLALTRWHEDDPAGRILGESWDGQSGLWEGTDGRLWLVLCIPLIADRDDDPLGRARGELLWPEWFDEKHVAFARAQGERSWNSLYQQRPSASDGNILKKSSWRCWPHGKAEPTQEQIDHPESTKPPEFGKWKQCILVYDTAFEEDEDSDYSAMTAWVTFETTKKLPQRKMAEEKQQNILMTGAWRGKVQASELIDIVLQHVKQFMPDRIVIEKRASGIQLIQELRKRRPRHQYGEVIIQDWLPDGKPGTNGKIPRAHSAAITLDEGCVWYMPGPLTEAVIKECGSFPNGRYKDWADTVTNMILFSRKTNLLEIAPDALSDQEIWEEEEEAATTLAHPKASYGHERAKPYTQAARNLYGRSSRA